MLEARFIFTNQKGTRSTYIKIGCKPALLNMKKGEWWLWHPDYFRYEDLVNGDMQRGDREESLIESKSVYKETTTKPIKIGFGTAPPQEITIKTILYREQEEIDCERILCFYRLDLNDNSEFPPLDERLKEFGDSVVFVDIEQLYKEIEVKNNTAKHYDIEYHAEDYSGSVGKSGKRDLYKYQNEHRIYLSSQKYGNELQRSEEIQKLYSMLDAEREKMSDCFLPKVRLRASYDSTSIASEICKLKCIHETVATSNDITTVPIQLDILLKSNSISDIFTSVE